MTEWEHDAWDAMDMLLDRLIVDRNDEHVGMVDDLELSPVGDGSRLQLTALLCGPTALGPRIGDRIGTWWLSVGRRLRPHGDPYPIRIAIEDVARVDTKQVKLRITRDQAGTALLRDWVDVHVTRRIPGGQR